MKLLSLMITGAALAWCQSAPETLFAHVDFVKPTQGKAADYHKALKESVMPKFQKAVDAGEAYAFLNTSRQFPHGSSLAATEVRFAFGRTLKSVATGVTNDVGMPPGLFTTAMGELWTMLYAQQLPKFFDAKYYRVLFLKTLPGKTSADIVNIYKAPATAPPTTNPYLIFSRSFRGPDDDFNVIVIHGNDELDQVAVGGVTPLTPASQLGLERFRDVRTVVRSELWGRRPEYVVPKK